AAAISVLTDEKYFQGSLNDLHAVRGASEIPILRKEFIIDEYQIYEARAAGADAVLLIPAIISDAEFVKFHNLIQQLGMTALVEVHTGQELRRAFRAFPRVIGINNRNLKDFSLDIQQTALLRKHIPPEICVVSESGIKTRADIAFLKNNNIQAALIGETFMKAPDPGVALMELIK
nr:indole-3-glycerol phosphate synthase TrpC [Candidatus Sumerlaeota bacterium]